MGNTDSKIDFRVAVVQLTSRSQVNRIDKYEFRMNSFGISSSKSNQTINHFGINFGRIKSRVFKIYLLLFQLLKFEL